ncbi:alpha-mannosidase [Paenibacillus sp. 453mf]|nr:alpha-mannosidase [Paenibacillus sp. 453mf]
MLRWYNMSANETALELKSNSYSSCYKRNILEEREEQVTPENFERSAVINMPVGACEIVTLGLIK